MIKPTVLKLTPTEIKALDSILANAEYTYSELAQKNYDKFYADDYVKAYKIADKLSKQLSVHGENTVVFYLLSEDRTFLLEQLNYAITAEFFTVEAQIILEQLMLQFNNICN